MSKKILSAYLLLDRALAGESAMHSLAALFLDLDSM